MDVVQTAMRRSGDLTSPQLLLLMAVGRGWVVYCGYQVLPLVPAWRAVPWAMPIVGSERNIQSIFYHPQKIYSGQPLIKLYLSPMGPMRRCG